ncbi:hypothetical protein Y032_0003g1536 [Ancylostoma ceylanicum]|uniref:Neurotransmitter-gated ion-channel transmembrane region n=1 Tax=Ancylostoma ceylanicum TaxID=53326 RepID=A0A016VY77_9BILA|nr:hypothetical protein Y032_0003g1536 [Ancylostoma ceylanicum]
MKLDEVMPIEERMADLRYDGTVRISNPSIEGNGKNATSRVDCSFLTKIARVWYNQSLSYLKGNSEWELSSIRAYSQLQPDSDETIYSSVVYQIELKRKPVYYVLVIQAPTFIMTTLTIFGIFTPFSNTPERREKVTLGLNMFVSISMMLNLVADMMPKASRLPLLGNYILAQIFVCAGAVLVSIVTLILHQRCHTRCLTPPQWLIRFLFCACCKKQIHPSSNDPPPYSVCKETPTVEILENPELLETVEKATIALRSTIDRLEHEDDIRLTWIRVFDRIDMVCLIAFQLLNVVSSTLFMR